MDYALFNGCPELLNANCLSPNLKLDHADGGFLLETPLYIRGDAVNLSLQLDSDTLCISQARGHGFCRIIRYADLKLQSVVGGHVCRPISLVFRGSFPSGKFFGEFASGTGCVRPDFLQESLPMTLE